MNVILILLFVVSVFMFLLGLVLIEAFVFPFMPKENIPFVFLAQVLVALYAVHFLVMGHLTYSPIAHNYGLAILIADVVFFLFSVEHLTGNIGGEKNYFTILPHIDVFNKDSHRYRCFPKDLNA